MRRRLVLNDGHGLLTSDWNLTQARVNGGLTANLLGDGRKVRFFVFSGLDSGHKGPFLASPFGASPTINSMTNKMPDQIPYRYSYHDDPAHLRA